MKPKIKKKQPAYVVEYPEAMAYAEMQRSVYWPPNEIDVAKDIQDMRVNLSESEYHAVVTGLKLFTKYELIAGNEYWGGRVKRMFPRPCIQTMANCFSFFEINVHAIFYNALNEALHLNTEEFYNSYVDNPALNDRMEFLEECMKDKDDLFSLGVFSMVEGAILYSSFAFFKHFQSQGKNNLINVVSGIDFSLRDENIHSEAGAWLFRTLLEESKLSDDETAKLQERLTQAAVTIYKHEREIISMMFEKGSISGITDHQMKEFVKSRLNVVTNQLGLEKVFDVSYNPIKDWFYDNINAVKLHDFFAKTGNEYHRNWNESRFVWEESDVNGD